MSRPKRIGEILPGVLRDIEKRCEQNPDNKAFSPGKAKHRQRIIDVTRGFFEKHRGRKTRGNEERVKSSAPVRRKAERCLF